MDYNKVSIKDMLTGKIEKSNSERGDISTGYRVVRMNGDGYMSKPCMEVSKTISNDGNKKKDVKKSVEDNTMPSVNNTAGQSPIAKDDKPVENGAVPVESDAVEPTTPAAKSASDMYRSLRDSGYSDEDIHKAVTGIVKSTVKKAGFNWETGNSLGQKYRAMSSRARRDGDLDAVGIFNDSADDAERQGNSVWSIPDEPALKKDISGVYPTNYEGVVDAYSTPRQYADVALNAPAMAEEEAKRAKMEQALGGFSIEDIQAYLDAQKKKSTAVTNGSPSKKPTEKKGGIQEGSKKHTDESAKKELNHAKKEGPKVMDKVMSSRRANGGE